MQTSGNDPSLAEASAQLAQWEAADKAAETPAPATPEVKADPASVTPEPTHAAQRVSGEVQPAEPKADGTPSTQDQQKPDENKTPEGSKFAQNQKRLEGGWNKLNEGKDQLAKDRKALEAERAELTKKANDLEQRLQQISQPKYKPEDYLRAATTWHKQAEEAEAAGDYEKADALRIEAKKANDYAKYLRDNPPPTPKTDAQQAEDFKALQKEWWGKAAIDFPNVVKPGSKEKEALDALIKSEPAIVNDPKGMYYAARLVTAETLAASVPDLKKELAGAHAKVKEFSEKLATPGDGVAATQHGEIPFAQKSDEEQFAQLQREARSLGGAKSF